MQLGLIEKYGHELQARANVGIISGQASSGYFPLERTYVRPGSPQTNGGTDPNDGGGNSKLAQAIPIAIGSAAIDGPIPVGDAVAVVILAGALVWDLLENPGAVTVPIHNPDAVRYYTPPPRTLPGFPGAYRDGHNAGRARWRTPEGDILEWDGQHGEIEGYTKRGKHTGAYDPNTGKRVKPPVPGRKTRN